MHMWWTFNTLVVNKRTNREGGLGGLNEAYQNSRSKLSSSLKPWTWKEKKYTDTVKNFSSIHLLTLTSLSSSCKHCWGKAAQSCLLFVDILMGSHQHPGHQDHEFIEGDLSISISIQFLEYFVNGGLIFGVLGEGDSRPSELRLSLPLSQPQSSA